MSHVYSIADRRPRHIHPKWYCPLAKVEDIYRAWGLF